MVSKRANQHRGADAPAAAVAKQAQTVPADGRREASREAQARPKRKRGFAAMAPELQRSIAAAGGRAAHAKGTAHEFTSDEARRAGAMSHKNDSRRKGGAAAPASDGDADDS